MKDSIRTGIFCAILAATGFLLAGIMGRALSLDPLVPFAMMAGVLAPMAMLASGILARWSSYCPFTGRQKGSPATVSLASGAITIAASLMIGVLMLALSGDSLFPGGMLSLNVHAMPGVAILFTAYLALAFIGGELYGIVFQRSARA